MEIQHIRYFMEVANCQSFTAAAERLYVTQPMLTRTIKRLEEDLNVKLIERTSKSFHLTQAGEVFLRQSMQLLQRYDDLYRVMDDLRTAQLGHVNLSTPGVLLDIYFAPLLIEFRKQCPNIDINIVEEGSKLVAQSILTDVADLGLVMLPVTPASKFVTHVVVSDVCQLVVSKDHPFAKRRSVHIQELADERILTFSHTATLHDTFINLCGSFGFEPHIAYKTLMPNFTMDIVKSSNLVAVLPRPVIQGYLTDQVAMIPLEPRIDWNIAVIYKRDRYRSTASQKLLEFMRSYFLQLQANRHSAEKPPFGSHT